MRATPPSESGQVSSGETCRRVVSTVEVPSSRLRFTPLAGSLRNKSVPKSRVLVRAIVNSGKRVSVVRCSVIRLTSLRPERAKFQADQSRLIMNEEVVRSLERSSIVLPRVEMNSWSLW